jgi:hypothetical protein
MLRVSSLPSEGSFFRAKGHLPNARTSSSEWLDPITGGRVAEPEQGQLAREPPPWRISAAVNGPSQPPDEESSLLLTKGSFMPRPLLTAVPLLTMLATLTLTDTAWAHGRDPHARLAARNGWYTNLTAAKREATRTSKPLMIVLRCFD